MDSSDDVQKDLQTTGNLIKTKSVEKIALEKSASVSRLELVQKLQDAWLATQKRSFTAWINFQLKPENVIVIEITEDFSSGVALAALLRVLSQENLKVNQNPKMRIHCIENVSICLRFIENKGVKLVNISAEEIVDKNIKIILGTIWLLIRKFKIEGVQEDDAAGNDALLLWVQRKVKDYGIRVHNFHTSWQSGLALAAIIHSTYPNVLNYHTLPRDNPSVVLEECFEAADQFLEIPRMLEISDLVGIEKPDDHSVITYISAHYQVQHQTKDWIANFAIDIPSLKQRLTFAIDKLSEPITADTREALDKLVAEFEDHCKNVYNVYTQDFNRVNKYTNSLKKMGLPVAEFDPSPFDEIERLHNNMLKLIQQRKPDLAYADEYLKDIEAFLAAYTSRLSEFTTQVNEIKESLNSLPSSVPERLSLLRGHSDSLAAQKRTLEELAHTNKRLGDTKVAAPSMDPSRQLWEDLSLRVKEQLDSLQLAESKLKQYAKDAPTLNAWIDKVSLQLENLSANAESVMGPGVTASTDELKGLVDQFTIINAVYTNKKKDYAKLTELVTSIHEAKLSETSYTNISFEDLTNKWNELNQKFQPVAKKVGAADDRINLGDRCSRFVSDMQEFLAAQNRARQERQSIQIRDNKDFENMVNQLSECSTQVGEKQQLVADALTNEDFVKEVGADSLQSLRDQLKELEVVLQQDKNELLQRKQDAELYATRSRELDTWLKASKESVTPTDKPVTSVDASQEETNQITSDLQNLQTENRRLEDLAWMLNDRNIIENIFGGLSSGELADHFDEVSKLYEDRKKFLAAAQEQLELALSIDQILDRERKILEGSQALKFTSPKEVEIDKKALQRHKNTVNECAKRMRNPQDQQQYDAALESKISTLLGDYDSEIYRKAIMTEIFQNYAKTADDLSKRISEMAGAFSEESIQLIAGAPDGAEQIQATVVSTGTKMSTMQSELSDFDSLVDQIRGAPYDQKENVYTTMSKEDVYEKFKGLEDMLAQVKENLDEFVKLVSVVGAYTNKLNNIRTDKLDDKKSVVLTQNSTTLREQEPAIKAFSDKPVLGHPLLARYETLVNDYTSAIQYWVIEEEKLDLFLGSAAQFEKAVIAFTNKIEDALSEAGRNLVAEYQGFLDEYKGLDVQYKDLTTATEHLKACDPTTRAEGRHAELSDRWYVLQEALERMRKRIHKGFTPEADILRARDYIASCRGPKFVPRESDKSISDPSMEANITRIVLLGDTAGKTAIISKFTKDTFPDNHVATTVEQHSEAIIDLDNKKYKTDILDTCPTEDRSSVTRQNWYSWGDAFMFVYSMNNLRTFENAYSVFTELLNKRMGKPFGLILVANENDNDINRDVTSLQGKSAALSMMCKYVEASAKTGNNLAFAFRELLRDAAVKKAVSTRVEREREGSNVKLTKSKSKKSKSDLLEVPKSPHRSLTADANIDWRVVRLNQLLVLYELQKEESNRFCADCGRDNPDWVARGFMVLLCVQCAHIHKMHILNPKIPKPRNLLMESFTQEEVVEFTALCNGRANMVLERVIPKNKVKPIASDPREVKVAWIKAKYIAHEFYLSMNNEINNNSFQFQNHISKKYARDKLISTRNGPTDKPVAVRLVGPKANNANEVIKADFFAAASISTFPAGDADESKVDGGDIVDKWGIDFGKNHLFAAIADGVGWGESPRKSATNATNEFLAFVDLNFHKITTVEDGAAMLQRSILVAHDSTTKDLDAKSVINYWEVGTTALLGGVMLYEKNSQGLLCVSVGNCKAFLVRYGKSLKVTDITSGSRDFSLHEDDPGGCIGPQQEAGAPDLRNLQIFYTPVEVGDVILMMTDGVYQNYDPEFLGLLPKDVGYVKKLSDTWKDVKPKTVNKLKSTYIEGLLEKTLDKVRTPAQIEQALLEHARVVTIPRRAFMEREGKTPPPNFESYPGKLDHSTVLAFTVAREYNTNV